MILRLAIASLGARTLTVAMTVLAIALWVALFLGVEKVRTGAKASFSDTISGTDPPGRIVSPARGPARCSFCSTSSSASGTRRTTSPGAAMSTSPRNRRSNGSCRSRWATVTGSSASWARPPPSSSATSIAGTAREIADGRALDDLFDAVIGADVAATLDYAAGDPIAMAHGIASFTEHDDPPFRISGISAKTARR